MPASHYPVDEHGERIKYKLKIPRRLRAYVLINTGLIFICFILLFIIENRIESPSMLGLLSHLGIIQVAAMVLVSLLSFGILNERKSWALKYEYFRLGFLAVNSAILLRRLPYAGLLVPASLLVLAGLALWIFRMRSEFKPASRAQLDSSAP